MLSVVSTPNATGTPELAAAWARPLAHAPATKSKCGVAPRITAPNAITAAYLPEWASLCATSAISHAPGTSGSTTNPLKRPATMAKRPLGAAKSPSMVFMIGFLGSEPCGPVILRVFGRADRNDVFEVRITADFQPCRAAVEAQPRRGAEWQGELLVGVAVRQAVDHRNAGHRADLGEGRRQVVAVVACARLALAEAAQDQRLLAAEHAGQVQLIEHALDPVRRLADVLDKQDAAVDRGEPRRTEQAAQHGEIAAPQRATQVEAGLDAAVPRHAQRRRSQRGPELLPAELAARFGAQIGQQRAAERAQAAPGVQGHLQRGEIAVPDQRHRRQLQARAQGGVIQTGQQPRRAITAAGDQRDVRQRIQRRQRVDVACPLGIAAGKTQLDPLKYFDAVHRAPGLAQPGHAARYRRAIVRMAGGGDQADSGWVHGRLGSIRAWPRSRARSPGPCDDHG